MIVGLAATIITVAVATVIGVPTGYFGGKLDLITQRFVDAWITLPSLLILLTVMSIISSGYHRGESGKKRCYRTTDRAAPTRIVMRNKYHGPLVVFSVNIGAAIMSEASLSFLGFGLPLEEPSWGGMLSHEGRRHMEVKPSLAIWPGVALATVIYGVNMFGDAVRDLLEVRTKTPLVKSDWSGGTEVARINDPLCPARMALHQVVEMTAREKWEGR